MPPTRTARAAATMAMVLLTASLLLPSAMALRGPVSGDDVQELVDGLTQELSDAAQGADGAVNGILDYLADAIHDLPDTTDDVTGLVEDLTANLADLANDGAALLVLLVSMLAQLLANVNHETHDALMAILTALQGFVERRTNAADDLTGSVLSPLPGVVNPTLPPDPAQDGQRFADYVLAVIDAATGFANDSTQDAQDTTNEVLGALPQL